MDQSSNNSSTSENGCLGIVILALIVVVVLPFLTCVAKYDYCNDERARAFNTKKVQSSFSIDLCGDYLICENCGQYHDDVIQRSGREKFFEMLLPICFFILCIILTALLISFRFQDNNTAYHNNTQTNRNNSSRAKPTPNKAPPPKKTIQEMESSDIILINEIVEEVQSEHGYSTIMTDGAKSRLRYPFPTREKNKLKEIFLELTEEFYEDWHDD